MSADNGVYILKTRAPLGGYEYRVKHAQAIGNIDWEPNYPTADPQLNLEFVLNYFGGCEVITDRAVALEVAADVYEEWIQDLGVVEYGIQLLDFSAVPFPEPQLAGALS